MNKKEREALRGQWVPLPAIGKLLDYCNELEERLEAGDATPQPTPEPAEEVDAPAEIVAWIYQTMPNIKTARNIAQAIKR